MRITRTAFTALALASQCLGDTLLNTISTRPELSTLTTLINGSTTLTTLLTNANAFTFLAPTNDAFLRFSSSTGNSSFPPIEATVAYHLLHGVFPTVAFTNVPVFVASNLENGTFSNVTGGQRVGIASNKAGPFLISGNKTQTTIVTPDLLVTGGLIQVINDVLDVPLSLVDALNEANLNFFVGLLNAGGLLNSVSSPILQPILINPDFTIFAPNSRSALDTFTANAGTVPLPQLIAQFQYHLIPSTLGYFNTLTDGLILKTANGQTLRITVNGSMTFVNDAKIISSNILVANGVVHALDGLLDPLNQTVPVIEAPTSARVNVTASDNSPTTAPMPTPPPDTDTGLSLAAIAGLAFPLGAIGVGCLGLGVWWLGRMAWKRWTLQHLRKH